MCLRPAFAFAVLSCSFGCGNLPPGGTGGGTGAAGGGASGTGGGSSAVSDLQSGTRLKAVVSRGSDGSTQAFTFGTIPIFWDTARSENCAVYPAGDFKSRCLPIFSVGSFGGEVPIYADAACQTELIEVPPQTCSQDTPGVSVHDVKYGIVSVTGATCNRYGLRVYLLGPAFTGGLFTKPNGSLCASKTRDPSTKYYSLGAEVPSTEFVEFGLGLL